ncbi:MAG: dihydrolipoamide acetyltransferase family protein [Acidimicrobiales bacterium]|jgi:2-oxoglutarate dehydrogenase E2 component (dihydrolipoamide succinyltransferase)
MPQLGETVTEGTITKWFKAVGDTVARDEPLFEVSTDKVDSEVPSPAAGVLTAILVEEGDTVDVGVSLAVIDGEPTATAGGPAPEAHTAPPAPTAPTAPTAPSPTAPVPAAPAPISPMTPFAALPDEPADVSTPIPPGVSPGPPAPPAAPPVAAAASPAVATAPSGTFGTLPPLATSNQSLVLSPVVRKLLTDHAIDPSTIRGTGLGGRITRSDVEAVIEHSASPAPVPSISGPAPVAPTPTAPASAATAAEATVPVVTAPAATGAAVPPPATEGREQAPGGRDEVIPFTNIRRRTAEHMVRSKATSAHTLMVKEIDYERVEQVRRLHGERFRQEEGFSLTYLPFVARATVEALAEFPHLNASVGDDALIVHHDVNLGIAVDLDNEGLIVPVVHRAEELNLRGMARRIRDVADRARAKRLSLDDISGGTFSITNAGPFGTLLTGAIINQPQVAILSTDGVSRKPVVVELSDGTESIGIHSVGLVAMNFDHRAVDGAYVARFLSRVSGILDDRDWVGEL